MFWWIIAAVCAFFIKGLCGFANTLVFTTVLSFGNNNIQISPVELLLGYPTNFILAWKERHAIKWSICIPLAVFVLAGSIPGVFFLKNADTGMIKIAFGVVIILVGAEMLLGEFQIKKRRQSKAVLGIIGILAGIMCGLYGVGALLGAYVNKVADDSSAFRANICVVFLAENTLRIILYAVWGIITPDIIKQAVILVPFMLAALMLGMKSSRFLDEKIIKKLVLLLLILSGVALIVNNLE